jgi:hypothetical protein
MLFSKKLKIMKTLNYLFNCWWKTVKRGKPNKRSFLIFLRMLGLEMKCLFFTGRTVEEVCGE